MRLTRQRLQSLNNAKPKNGKLKGTRKGYTDESFHMGLSRGFSTVVPVVRKDAAQLHEFGPFYKGPLCFFVGNSPIRY
jgi:hypothetical protein